jgi:hypothetical protein
MYTFRAAFARREEACSDRHGIVDSAKRHHGTHCFTFWSQGSETNAHEMKRRLFFEEEDVEFFRILFLPPREETYTTNQSIFSSINLEAQECAKISS